jgi:hypothetical protein
VYIDANIVMGAESADFFFDCWYSKVITDDLESTEGVALPGNSAVETQPTVRLVRPIVNNRECELAIAL